MQRREFLALAACPAAQAFAPSNILLGYDTYSLRAWKWKALEHIGYAARQKLDAIQISSLDDFESLEPAHLARVRSEAERTGIRIDAGIGCICGSARGWNARHGAPAEYLRKGIRVSQAVGATTMRCFLGSSVDRLDDGGIERHIENTVAALRQVRREALDANVKIAVENHSGDMQARELRTLIEAAGRDFTAACLDTGNPFWCIEDPAVTLEILGPFTVTTHIRDTAVFEHPRGAAAQWVALGEGSVDFRAFMRRFAELCPNSALQLENITGRPPRVLPYLEADFWKAFPNANAAEFSRFVALVKRGKPYFGGMIIADVEGTPPPAYAEALKEQQRVDLERGFEYARKILDAGIRWRR